MKATKYLLAAATVLAFGFASCEDDDNLGVKQENGQPALMSADGVTVAYGSDVAGTAINLNDFENKPVDVLKITKAELPEGAEISSITMQVSNTADYENFVNLPVVDGCVSADNWVAFLKGVRANSPAPMENYIRFRILCSDGNSQFLIGGSYMAEKTIQVVSYIPVEDSYYLVGKYLGDNKIDQAIKMHRSKLDVYSDPNFFKIVDVTEEQAADGYTWLVVPESQLNAGNFDGCYGAATADDTEVEGKLVLGGKPFVINSKGARRIAVNMEYKSYKVSFAFLEMYTPGPANGWAFGDNNLYLTSTDYENFQGFFNVVDMFKFTGEKGWGLNWGLPKDANGDPVGPFEDKGTYTGDLASDGANITVPSGLYWGNVSMSAMTFSITFINSVSIIGGFNNWGDDVILTPSDDFTIWTGTLTLDKESEWKFRFNRDWGINLGGTEQDLVPNGGNLKSDAGEYVVTLDLGVHPYSCTVVPAAN